MKSANSYFPVEHLGLLTKKGIRILQELLALSKIAFRDINVEVRGKGNTEVNVKNVENVENQSGVESRHQGFTADRFQRKVRNFLVGQQGKHDIRSGKI